jgi:hypothetical protein
MPEPKPDPSQPPPPAPAIHEALDALSRGAIADPAPADDDRSIVPQIHLDPADKPQNPHNPTPATFALSARALEMRRTIVPVLLTTGALAVVLGGLWFTTSEDSPFRETGAILPAGLVFFGLTLVGLGLMNAMEIHRHLHRRQSGSRPGRGG